MTTVQNFQGCPYIFLDFILFSRVSIKTQTWGHGPGGAGAKKKSRGHGPEGAGAKKTSWGHGPEGAGAKKISRSHGPKGAGAKICLIFCMF